LWEEEEDKEESYNDENQHTVLDFTDEVSSLSVSATATHQDALVHSFPQGQESFAVKPSMYYTMHIVDD
jgi:hypothetical protein